MDFKLNYPFNSWHVSFVVKCKSMLKTVDPSSLS